MRRPIPATHHINFLHGGENLCENFVAMTEFWQRRKVARKSNWFFRIKLCRGGKSLDDFFAVTYHGIQLVHVIYYLAAHTK